MIHQALVLALGNTIEEEVKVKVSGLTMVCFAVVCPYPVAVGSS